MLFKKTAIGISLICIACILCNAQAKYSIKSDKNGKYGVYSSGGEWLIRPRYSKIYSFGDFFICNTDNTCTIYNQKGGRMNIDLPNFHYANPISEKLLLVQYNYNDKAIVDFNLNVKLRDLTGVDGFARINLTNYKIAIFTRTNTAGVFNENGDIILWNRDEVVIKDGTLLCRTGNSWEEYDVSDGKFAYVGVDFTRSNEYEAKEHILRGDQLYKKEEYWEAAMEFSKAIDLGYLNFTTYFKRASAFYSIKFYKNAIDDFTEALSYKEDEEAYLYRGLAKLNINILSGFDDLKKGGPKGNALAKEYAPTSASIETGASYIASGTGFFIDERGYIVTNFHVIEGANSIDVFINSHNGQETYKAREVISDKSNDISILKIEYRTDVTIPYEISMKHIDVGTSVFAMGYPLLSTLGEEIKTTDGIVSAKSGYQGDVSTYQISSPIQPGNSGGPLFDKEGYLIGITNAGVPSLQNVGYAIKMTYLFNLIDACPEIINLPEKNLLLGKSFTEQIKLISPYIVIIKIR